MNRIYTFYSEQERDFEEAKEYAAMAVLKSPAFVELIKFIYDVFYGLKPEISEKKIDDAFECLINRDKKIIKISNMSQEDKEEALHHSETEWELRKIAFKNSLKEKTDAQSPFHLEKSS